MYSMVTDTCIPTHLTVRNVRVQIRKTAIISLKMKISKSWPLSADIDLLEYEVSTKSLQ